MSKKFIFVILCVALLISCALNQRTTSTPKQETSEYSFKRLKRVLHKYVDRNQIAGIQSAILKDNKLIHFDSYGFANIEKQKVLDSSSIFRIFSMTKPITSVGLMQLYEQGKFNLEDSVSQYIPEFQNMKVYDDTNAIVEAKRSIKIIDLLRHTSGISYGHGPNKALNEAYKQAHLGTSKDLKSFIKNISQLPLAFEPGTDYEYGYSTDVCGYLIEVLSGQPVDEYLLENIIKPLQMNDTHFQLPKEKINRFVTGYRPGKNDSLIVSELPESSRYLNTTSFIKAGAGLVSTTSDYLNFCKMLLNKGSLFGERIISSETLDLMTKDQLDDVRKFNEKPNILKGETGFGLGFSILERQDGSVDYGWGGAAGTYFRIDPSQDLAYIMMIQLIPYRQLGLSDTFKSLVNDAIKTKKHP